MIVLSKPKATEFYIMTINNDDTRSIADDLVEIDGIYFPRDPVNQDQANIFDSIEDDLAPHFVCGPIRNANINEVFNIGTEWVEREEEEELSEFGLLDIGSEEEEDY